jgi:uncharacterized protein
LTVFVDTSALYALVDRTDPRHPDVSQGLRALAGRPLLTHSYVVLESAALAECRLGRAVSHRLLRDILAPVEVVYIDESTHLAATGAYLAAGSRGPSLVDFASFEVMRARGITRAFALDRHFAEAGFELVT